MNNSVPETTSAPEGRGGDAGSWVVRGLVAIGLLGMGIGGYVWLARVPTGAPAPAGAPQPVRSRVVELRKRDFPVVVRSQGVVRAREELSLSAQVAGRVARVAPEFEDGAFFDAGEVLVELDAEDFQTAVAMADARLQSTRAAAVLAELNQDRDAALLRNSLLTSAQAEATAATLAQARAESAMAQAQLERARRDLDRTRVRAPFAGCVRRRTVAPGQWVSPGSVLGMVFSVEAVEVRLPVSGPALAFLELPGERIQRTELPWFPRGGGGVAVRPNVESRMEVSLEDALNASSDSRWSGFVVRGEQALDGETLERFAIVRVEDPFGFDSGRRPLRPGQPVTGFLPGAVLTNVYVLPRIAVRELDRIQLVDPTTKLLSSRRIVALWSDEQNVVMRDPSIPDGTLLATTHLVYAPEGAKVEIIPEITNAPSASPRGGDRGTNAASASGGAR